MAVWDIRYCLCHFFPSIAFWQLGLILHATKLACAQTTPRLPQISTNVTGRCLPSSSAAAGWLYDKQNSWCSFSHVCYFSFNGWRRKSFFLWSMAIVKKDDRLTSSQSLLCVGFAGIFSKSVTSPLEVVKILSQIGTFHCKRGFLHSFVLICQNEGLRAFWKGNMVSCLRLFPYSAIHLATYKK